MGDFATPHQKQRTAPFFLLGKMTHVLLFVKLWNADSGCHCTKPSYDHLIKGSLMLDDDEKLCYLIVRSICTSSQRMTNNELQNTAHDGLHVTNGRC